MTPAFPFEPVPPPRQAPRYAASEPLGILPCLRAERWQRQFRCLNCLVLRPAGSIIVWVPDDVRRDDPDRSIEEAARVNTFDGLFSGWCVACARKLGRPDASAAWRQTIRAIARRLGLAAALLAVAGCAQRQGGGYADPQDAAQRAALIGALINANANGYRPVPFYALPPVSSGVETSCWRVGMYLHCRSQ